MTASHRRMFLLSCATLTASSLALGAVGTVAAPPAEALDACLSSALGTLGFGSASCSAKGLSIAVAVGAGAVAGVDGWLATAWALGSGATAFAGSGDIALALGRSSRASATEGPLNVALSTGEGSSAVAADGALELVVLEVQAPQ